MPEKNDSPVSAAVKSIKAKGSDGTIVFCKNLHAWRCVNAQGRQVLVTGSKDTAVRKFPSFTLIEKE